MHVLSASNVNVSDTLFTNGFAKSGGAIYFKENLTYI
jgi:predicted outer membrane repeat protein